MSDNATATMPASSPHTPVPLEAPTAATPPNAPPRRVLTQPQDVLRVVAQQLDLVTDARDNLTVTLKGLTDLTKQLARAYAVQAQAMQQLQARVQGLEAQVGTGAAGDRGPQGLPRQDEAVRVG